MGKTILPDEEITTDESGSDPDCQKMKNGQMKSNEVDAKTCSESDDSHSSHSEEFVPERLDRQSEFKKSLFVTVFFHQVSQACDENQIFDNLFYQIYPKNY